MTTTQSKWQHERLIDDAGNLIGISIGGSITSAGERKVTMINPDQKRWHDHCYVLYFGAYGWTRLHVYADCLEEALEECAEWLADHAPGLITKPGSEEYNDLMREACEESGLAWPVPEGTTEFEPYWEAEDSAMADMTHTDSGWIASWEWGVALEDPTSEVLYQYVTGQ